MLSATQSTSPAQQFCESLYPTATAYLETFFASHLHAQGYSFDDKSVREVALHYAYNAINTGIVEVVQPDFNRSTTVYLDQAQAANLLGGPLRGTVPAPVNGPIGPQAVVHPYPFAGSNYAV